MMPRDTHRASGILALGLLPGLLLAQQKVAGELWRQTTSMDMKGMSMPSRTMEMCVPVGKANETLSRPQNSDCKVYDAKTVGNRFTAKMSCTGRAALEGEIETVTEGKTVRGTTHMKMQGGEATMKFESTRLGTACEVPDYSTLKRDAGARDAAGPEQARHKAQEAAEKAKALLRGTQGGD
jgi:Protein of unknown function (DUF3617)